MKNQTTLKPVAGSIKQIDWESIGLGAREVHALRTRMSNKGWEQLTQLLTEEGITETTYCLNATYEKA
ncbi:hypothetical protein OAA10_00350 [bacterium]|nr:hypothetical protein [bacterium]